MDGFKKRTGFLATKHKKSFMVLGALRYMYFNGESSTEQLRSQSTLINGKLLRNTRYAMNNRKLGALLAKDYRVISKGIDRQAQTTIWDLSEAGTQWCAEEYDCNEN